MEGCGVVDSGSAARNGKVGACVAMLVILLFLGSVASKVVVARRLVFPFYLSIIVLKEYNWRSCGCGCLLL